MCVPDSQGTYRIMLDNFNRILYILIEKSYRLKYFLVKEIHVSA